MKTHTSTNRAAAVELLRKGEIVALPTETVYGLAADALNPVAVAKIFEAKERPRFDPLIVHLPSHDWLERIATISPGHRQLVSNLLEKFWPGPFTIILRRRDIVPEIVTAGLDTVAVRISSHPVFAEIVRELDQPLAAPSANRFGRISPTTAQHVVDELAGQIPLVIDAGPPAHGVESTIVSVRRGNIEILRQGPVTAEQLSEFTKVSIVGPQSGKISAPGQLSSHYAPRTPLKLVDNPQSFSVEKTQRVGLLAWEPVLRKGDFSRRSAALRTRQIAQRRAVSACLDLKFAAVRNLSDRQDIREAAANLFRYLRELDQLRLDLILAERVPARGLGAAIMDRLQRAAHDPLDEQDTPE